MIKRILFHIVLLLDVSTDSAAPAGLDIKIETDARTLDVPHIKVKEEVPFLSEVRKDSLVFKPEFVNVAEYTFKTEAKIKEDPMYTEPIFHVKQETGFETS